MSKVSTYKLAERAVEICQCGSCLTCMMAHRLLGQVEEINNQLRSNARGISMLVKQSQAISGAIKYLREDRPKCALAVLRNDVPDGNAILEELANGDV